MIATREQVTHDIRVYMSRTGSSALEIANSSGLAYPTVKQLISGARFGTPATDGERTAERLALWLAEQSLPMRQSRGRLYETQATRLMAELVDYCAEGRIATCCGPAGAQKTFYFHERAVRAAADPEPGMVMVEVPGPSTPTGLLRLIASEIGAPYACSFEAARRGILGILRQRRQPLVVVLDDADLLYHCVDTLEVMRRLYDVAAGALGLLISGNEDIQKLFEPRKRGKYFEQWRSRRQREERVLGPSRAEARDMLLGERPGAAEEWIDRKLDGAEVIDPLPDPETRRQKKYINARTLFLSLRQPKRRVN